MKTDKVLWSIDTCLPFFGCQSMPKRAGEKNQLPNFVLVSVAGLIWQCLMGKGLCSHNTDEALRLEMQLMEKCCQYPILTERKVKWEQLLVSSETLANISNSSPECAMFEDMHPLDDQSGQHPPQGCHRVEGYRQVWTCEPGVQTHTWVREDNTASPLQRFGALSS